METDTWRAYSELAWTDRIVSSVEDHEEETEFLAKSIKEHGTIEIRTLLHLGCGAGFHDYIFKRHFAVTGVDISRGMLDMAREQNPEIIYHLDDMRTARLKENFDAVAIPDSIGYMTTREDLKAAIGTANTHLNPGGVLLIVAHTREEFKENNFVYTGQKGDLEVTIFENNRILDTGRTGYEATVVYLIRRKGELEFHTDRHLIGLFGRDEWTELLTAAGLEVDQQKMMDNYGQSILGEGEYPQSILICRKPLKR